MKMFSVALVYMAFFGLVGFAVWYTETANCLWALVLTPSFKCSTRKKKKPETVTV